MDEHNRCLRGNGYCQPCLLRNQLVTLQYEKWDEVFRIRSD
jgi:hypothetical protein